MKDKNRAGSLVKKIETTKQKSPVEMINLQKRDFSVKEKDLE